MMIIKDVKVIEQADCIVQTKGNIYTQILMLGQQNHTTIGLFIEAANKRITELNSMSVYAVPPSADVILTTILHVLNFKTCSSCSM